MRILHTADWHLGRTFGPYSLLDDQVAFVEWLLRVVREERIELVVVAGDIYDRAVAPNDAIVAWRHALIALQSIGAKVVAITGNHDGADRVAAYDTLLDGSGVVLRGGYTRPGEVICMEFRDGPLDVVPIPFLSPMLAPTEYLDRARSGGPGAPSDGTRPSHELVLAHALKEARACPTAPRSIVISHAFVDGGSSSESENALVVGGTGQVNVSLFDGFSYVALGHLHRPQAIGSDRVRYSGTPLAYSFSEEHSKSVVIVDMDPDGTFSSTVLPTDVGRRVKTITGTMDRICNQATAELTCGSFVRAVVTDPGVVLDARDRLARWHPYIAEIKLQPTGAGDGSGAARFDPGAVSPLDAAVAFWSDIIGSGPSDEEVGLLSEALAAAVQKEDA